jgi:hypothetical protein
MAPQRSSFFTVSQVCRGLTVTLALLALCVGTSSEAASDAGSKRKARKRSIPEPHIHEEAAPPPARPVPLLACQDAVGRTSYSQFPCANADAHPQRQLTTRDTRGASEVEHSSWMMQRERALLQTMQRDRQREAKLSEKARQSRSRTRRKSASADEDTPQERPDRSQPTRRPVRYLALPPLTAETQVQGRLRP